MRAILRCVLLAVALLGASPASSYATDSSDASSSNGGLTANATLPHCRDFQRYCALNVTTASCAFQQSVSFRCGASTIGNGSATGSDVDDDCRWELTGDLVLGDSVRVEIQGDDCALQLSVGKMLELRPNAALRAASVSVHASFVRIETDATIQARVSSSHVRGRSLMFPGDGRVGASHGGSGGKRVFVNETTAPEQQIFGAFFDTRTPGVEAVRAAGAWDLEALWATAMAQDDHAASVDAALLLLGSGATVSNNSVAGGGRVRVVASRDLVMMAGASIVADGDDASCDVPAVGGGSGGSVFVSATALSLTDSVIHARGGDACCASGFQGVVDCVPGGGGGRIHIAYVSSQLDDHAVDVSGGTLLLPSSDADKELRDRLTKLVHPVEMRALSGAGGTYLRVVRSSKTSTTSETNPATEAALVLTNRRAQHHVVAIADGETEETSPASIGGGAVTPVVVDKSHRRLDNVVVRNGAAVSTHVLHLPTGDLDVHNRSFLLDISVSSSSKAAVASVVTSLSSSSKDETVRIDARNILVTDNARVLLPRHGAVVRADAVSLDASVLLRFTKDFTVSSVNNLHIEAKISSEIGQLSLVGGKDVYVGGVVAVGSLAIHANGSLSVDAASLDASQSTAAGARFQPCSPRQFQSTASEVTSPSSVESFLSFVRFSNFTMLLQASESIGIGVSAVSSATPLSGVALTASAVLLCAQEQIALGDDAFISSSGRGQLANQGPGSGDCVGSVGGGGGYGGRGADSSAVNEVGDYAGGGLAYGTRGGIGMLGSGGGCVDGGAGGGVVMIGARGVVLNGQVSCNGNGGINSGGGGSGGFLGLTIADYLKGHGRISAVGGGAQCLELTDKKLREIGEDIPVTTRKANASTVHTFSLKANDAAAATAVAATATATTASSKRVCGGGGGGGRLQLHGCEKNDVDKCTSGFEGNYTVSGGTTSLTSRSDSGGDANADKEPAGASVPATPSKKPDIIKPAASGSFVGFPCPPGSGGLFCRVCVPGTFKAESNSEECLVCKNAPSNAHYVGLGAISEACMWTCDPGYSGDLCVSPIQQLLDACGGFLGFAVVLLSIVGFLILLGFACRSRKEPGYTRNVGGGRPGGRGIPGGAASTKGERQHLLSAAIASTQRSRFAFLLRWLYWPRVGYPKLVERDLHEHMARIYLTGLNDHEAPLKLRLTVPPQLKSVLYEDEFRQLAERINAVLAWPSSFFGSWGEMVYRLVVLLCLPGASAVLAYRRHLRVNALKRIIARYNHACMKGPRARGLLNALKLGYSGDYSLVYLELLYKESSQSACVPTTKIGKPSLPIVLLFAGRGTYESPFYLDPSDLLVRSIPQCPELTAFIDEPWIEFVAELNELLRVVSREEVRLVETLLPVAQFLEKKMATVSAGTAGAGKLGGLRIYLGRFYVGDDVDCGEEFKLGILLTTASAESGGGVYAFEPTSQAQSLTTSGMAPTSGGRNGGYGTYNTRALDSMDGYGRALPTDDAMLAYDTQSGGWSYAPASSASGPNSRAYVRRGSIGSGNGPPSHKSTVSSIREEALRIRSNTSGSVDNLFLAGGGHLTDFDSPDMFTNHPRSGRIVDGRRGGRSSARRRRRQTFYEGWLGPVDGSLPVPGVLISADELDDRLSDRTKQQLVESFLRRLFLPTNVPQSRWLSAAWMVHSALLSLLMVDLAITFAMVVNLRCVTNGEVDTECSATILMPVLLLPPLTLFLAPIMGIVSLAIASNSFSRRYAIWNALSMVNVGVAILVCLTQSSRLVAPWFTAPLPLLPAIAMLVKTGEAYVIERYIAFQETNRRRRGWRGLMKRRLSDASIPTESPYSSPVSSDNIPSYLTTGSDTTTFR